MDEDALQKLDEWKVGLEAAWRDIPKAFRNDHTVRRTLQCRLFRHLQESGYRVVADYMPPRIQDRPIDIIALGGDQEIVFALCLDIVVTLAAVKSLNSFAAVNKVIFTTGLLEKKVQESRFFLSPEIHHIHLKAFEKVLH